MGCAVISSLVARKQRGEPSGALAHAFGSLMRYVVEQEPIDRPTDRAHAMTLGPTISGRTENGWRRRRYCVMCSVEWAEEIA